MGRLFAVEIVYRGIFQKTLAKHISRAIVLAAHREGKPGISFGRYGDSPERNGIPAKAFAIVATDDLTDVRVLGAIARVLPELFSIETLKQMILDDGENPLKATSAQRSYDRLTSVTVKPNQGNPEKPYEFELLKWTEMRDGITIPSIAQGHTMTDPVTGKTGGFQPERNA